MKANGFADYKTLALHGLNIFIELIIFMVMLKKCTTSTNAVTNSAISLDMMFI